MQKEAAKHKKPETGDTIRRGNLEYRIPLKQNPFGTDRLIRMAEHENYGFIRMAEGDVHNKLEFIPEELPADQANSDPMAGNSNHLMDMLNKFGAARD
jgi:hypothetical protein